RSDVRRGELNLITAKAKLQALLGRKASSEEFDILGELKESVVGPRQELTPLVELALATRPDWIALERQTARAQSDLKLQLAQAKVDYTVGSEYRRQGFNNGANTLGVFLSIPIPFVQSQSRGDCPGDRRARTISPPVGSPQIGNCLGDESRLGRIPLGAH